MTKEKSRSGLGGGGGEGGEEAPSLWRLGFHGTVRQGSGLNAKCGCDRHVFQMSAGAKPLAGRLRLVQNVMCRLSRGRQGGSLEGSRCATGATGHQLRKADSGDAGSPRTSRLANRPTRLQHRGVSPASSGYYVWGMMGRWEGGKVKRGGDGGMGEWGNGSNSEHSLERERRQILRLGTSAIGCKIGWILVHQVPMRPVTRNG